MRRGATVQHGGLGLNPTWLLPTVLGLVAFAILVVPRSASAACANEALRTGPSAALPDCRAYEKVSPAEKNGSDAVRPGLPTFGTADGNGIAFMGYGSFAGTVGATLPNAYLARRSESGWQVTGADAPSPDPTPPGANQATYEFSQDLSHRVASVIKQSLAEGASAEYYNLFAVGPEGRYSWVNNKEYEATLPEDCPEPRVEQLCWQFVNLLGFAGASQNFEHVLYEYHGEVLGPESFEDLYRSDLEGGTWHVSPVGVLPDGRLAPEGSTAGSGTTVFYSSAGPTSDNRVINAISADGANVIFQAKSDEGEPNEAGQAGMTEVYDRIGRARTIELSAPAPGATPANPAPGPATFLAASTDGSRVFFTSPAELTTNSNTGPAQEGNDLYEYDFNTAGGTLRDLSVDADGAGARVLGVLNASDDGSTVYFVARGELSPGRGEAGEPNLYMIRNGSSPVFITTLGAADGNDWEEAAFERPGGAKLESYVTPNGEYVAFTSRLSLPTVNFPGGYNNENQQTHTAEPEVYEYSAATGELLCASCDPSGASPIGAGTLGGVRRPEVFEGITQNSAFHLVRPLSANGGRLFFSSQDPLVPSIPSNSTRAKVFEFERSGEGSCVAPAGCVSLISSPTDPREAVFLEADESGRNVFIASGDHLTSADEDNALDLYDARVDGGFPEPPPQLPCEAEGCKGAGSSAAPSTVNSPTGSFKGPGNPKAKATPKKCHKGQVKKHGKCLKKKKAKKHRIRHGKAHKRHGDHHKKPSRERRSNAHQEVVR